MWGIHKWLARCGGTGCGYGGAIHPIGQRQDRRAACCAAFIAQIDGRPHIKGVTAAYHCPGRCFRMLATRAVLLRQACLAWWRLACTEVQVTVLARPECCSEELRTRRLAACEPALRAVRQNRGSAQRVRQAKGLRKAAVPHVKKRDASATAHAASATAAIQQNAHQAQGKHSANGVS